MTTTHENVRPISTAAYMVVPDSRPEGFSALFYVAGVLVDQMQFPEHYTEANAEDAAHDLFECMRSTPLGELRQYYGSAFPQGLAWKSTRPQVHAPAYRAAA